MSERAKAARIRLDEQHDDLCRSWGLFGAGCDCGATKSAFDRIVREATDGFSAQLKDICNARR